MSDARIINFRGVRAEFTQLPKQGDTVVVYNPGNSTGPGCPQVGTKHEALGVVLSITMHKREGLSGYTEEPVADVEWPNERRGTYYLKDLFLVSEFSEKYPPMVQDKFKPNDIVYIGYRSDRSGGSDWPMVSTEYEIDCKVVEVITTPMKFYKHYVLVSGNGVPLNAKEEDLITVKQRDEYIEGNVIYTAAETAFPLYVAGHQFRKIGNYLVSKDPDISIHISKIKNNNFLCTILDKQ